MAHRRTRILASVLAFVPAIAVSADAGTVAEHNHSASNPRRPLDPRTQRRSARDNVEAMRQDLTEVLLLLQAAHIDGDAAVTECLRKKAAQIARNLRLAEGIEMMQLETALRLDDSIAEDVSASLAARAMCVSKLLAEAEECGEKFEPLLEGVVSEVEGDPLNDDDVDIDWTSPPPPAVRPPVASPYRLEDLQGR